MTPDDIRSQRFATRLVRGLSPEEVSAFLEDVAEAFDDIQKANAALAQRVKLLEDEIHALSIQETAVRPLRESAVLAVSHGEGLRAAALREVEALLHDAQAQAQGLIDAAAEREAAVLRDAEAAMARAQRESEEMLAEATASTASLIAAAKAQETTLREEIERLAQSHVELLDSIGTTLDTYCQWLATVDPRRRARGVQDVLQMPGERPGHVDAPEEAHVG
jgi:DivIVA domain-containing protein